MIERMGVLGFILCGCTAASVDSDSGNPTETCFDQTPSIELGQGEREFEAFEEPYESMMIHGPQGGWHILASLQTQGMMDIVEVNYTIEHLETGVLVSDNTYRLAVVSNGDCAGYYPGMYGYLAVSPLYDGDLDTPPELLGGDMLRLKLRVTDCSEFLEDDGQCIQSQRWAEAKIDVLAVLDPIDIESTDTGDSHESEDTGNMTSSGSE